MRSRVAVVACAGKALLARASEAARAAAAAAAAAAAGAAAGMPGLSGADGVVSALQARLPASAADALSSAWEGRHELAALAGPDTDQHSAANLCCALHKVCSLWCACQVLVGERQPAMTVCDAGAAGGGVVLLLLLRVLAWPLFPDAETGSEDAAGSSSSPAPDPAASPVQSRVRFLTLPTCHISAQPLNLSASSARGKAKGLLSPETRLCARQERQGIHTALRLVRLLPSALLGVPVHISALDDTVLPADAFVEAPPGACSPDDTSQEQVFACRGWHTLAVLPGGGEDVDIRCSDQAWITSRGGHGGL